MDSNGNAFNLGQFSHHSSFPIVLGDFGCDVTCQACRENSPIITNPKWRYRATTLAKFLQKASETGWVSLVNVCYEVRKVVGEFSFKEYMVNSPGYKAEHASLIQIVRYAKIFEKMMSRLEYEISKRKALQLYLSQQKFY